MTTVATEDQESPTSRVSLKLAFLMWLQVVGLHQGQRKYDPRRKAGHTIAAVQIVRSAKIVLAIRGRPHTTIGGWSRSTPPPVTISSKSSRSDTAGIRWSKARP